MSDEPLVSYAQNREDVVLWRALGDVRDGVYVDVGGWDPDVDSVTRIFYEHGWRGVDIEPVPEFARRFRERRPRDEVVQAAVVAERAESITLHRFGTSGLSTVDDNISERHEHSGLDHEDIQVPALRLDDVLSASELVDDTIHFLKVDVEGAEDQVIASIDLHRWRPWVLVVEATEPNSTAQTHDRWEPMVLEAGYTFTLFDGLSRFYVSPDHPELVEKLSYPACVLDNFVSFVSARVAMTADSEELEAARKQAVRWRNEAVNYWANAVAKVQTTEEAALHARHESQRLSGQLARVREHLQQVRTERKQLRERVKRMTARIERMTARIEQLEEREQTSTRPTAGRLRGAVKKVTGA